MINNTSIKRGIIVKKGSINKRDFLKKGLTIAGASTVATSAIAQQVCQITGNQPEGPFSPIQDQADKTNDLTTIRGQHRQGQD